MNVTENRQEVKGKFFTLGDLQLRTHVHKVVRHNVKETRTRFWVRILMSYTRFSVMNAMIRM